MRPTALPAPSRTLTTRLALCAVATLTLGACAGGGGTSVAGDAPARAGASRTPSPSAHSTPPPTAPTAPTAPTPSSRPAKRYLQYAGGESPGVIVEKRSDARLLRGAPAGLKRFVADTVERLSASADCEAPVSVSVAAVRTDGFAVGGVGACGSYAALWAVVDGAWQEIEGTQDAWGCRVLRRYQVPSQLVGRTCVDYAGDHQEHRYRQA